MPSPDARLLVAVNGQSHECSTRFVPPSLFRSARMQPAGKANDSTTPSTCRARAVLRRARGAVPVKQSRQENAASGRCVERCNCPRQQLMFGEINELYDRYLS